MAGGGVPNVQQTREFWTAAGLSLFAALVFGFTTKDTMHDFDYTVRIASALLDGHLGLERSPGSWLNEMVPFEGKYYSVFPLGAVLSMMPVALLQRLGWIHIFLGRLVTAFIAGLCVFFFFRLSIAETKSIGRRILLALFPIFATWTWCNLGFGGSWQIALGFALLGQIGALYFTLVQRRPLVGGAFFALAFGNRTELIITLPIYLYLLCRASYGEDHPRVPHEGPVSSDARARDEQATIADSDDPIHVRQIVAEPPSNAVGSALSLVTLAQATPDDIPALSGSMAALEQPIVAQRHSSRLGKLAQRLQQNWPAFASFVIVPALLALLTAAYNFARFHSFFDFGYTRIPGVLNEPWYQHGLFSLHAIQGNLYHMLFKGLGDTIPKFPYIQPYGFGCSIFLASPFLFLLFREGGGYTRAAWIAIGMLTAVLWTHGNPGGWQFSYRYATILLPWMFLLITGNGPARPSLIEISLFAVSVVVNALATYEFLWTKSIHP